MNSPSSPCWKGRKGKKREIGTLRNSYSGRKRGKWEGNASLVVTTREISYSLPHKGGGGEGGWT